MDDSDNIGGTSISKLKNMKQVKNDLSDIEIDYSTILDDIKQDPEINIPKQDARENAMKSIQSTNDSKKKKKNINMNSFVRNLETNIENLSKKNINDESVQIVVPSKNDVPEKTWCDQFIEFKYLDIIFGVLLFMILNNRLTIETLYKLPYMNPEVSTVPNLLLRSIIFGILLFLIKKYILSI
jgi:hypothetical protein